MDLLGRVGLLLLLLVWGRLGIMRRSRLMLDLAKLSLVVSGSSLRVGKTGPDEEEEVDDGQNPSQGAEGCAGRKCRAFAGTASVDAEAQPDRGSGGGPRPSGKPENDAQDVGHESDDAVEHVRSPDFDSDGATHDDECLDGNKDQESASSSANNKPSIWTEERDGISCKRKHYQAEH